ncbi:MAG: glycosyltransferase [Candidatus Sumerlaeia bacterium]
MTHSDAPEQFSRVTTPDARPATPTGRRLLFIAYNFPPQLSGVRRTVKFIKYLAPLGWDIDVLTVKSVRCERYDWSPLLEIRGLCRVHRTGSLDPYRLACLAAPGRCRMDTPFQAPANGPATTSPYDTAAEPRRSMHGESRPGGRGLEPPMGFSRASGRLRSAMRFLRHWVFVVDDRVGWWPFALFRAIQIIRRRRPDWIVTTSLPNTAHLVGLALKRLFPHLRWAADFRDGWTQSRHYYAPPTPLHRWANEHLERAVARRCNLLLSVSPPLTDYFVRLLGGPHAPAARKVRTLTNGYDPEDFAALPPDAEPPADAFELVYTGSFFGSRSPAGLLEGLARFLTLHPEAAGRFRAVFYSQWDAAWLDQARSLGLDGVVDVRGFAPYAESLAAQARATALLLLIPAVPHEPVMMTQKVFEYLAAHRPILALAPEGVAARVLLSETGGAAFAHPDDPAAIADSLGRLWDAWLRGELDQHYQPRGIERFARPRLARQLHEWLIGRVNSEGEYSGVSR